MGGGRGVGGRGCLGDKTVVISHHCKCGRGRYKGARRGQRVCTSMCFSFINTGLSSALEEFLRKSSKVPYSTAKNVPFLYPTCNFFFNCMFY